MEEEKNYFFPCIISYLLTYHPHIEDCIAQNIVKSEPSRSCDKNVAASLQLARLINHHYRQGREHAVLLKSLQLARLVEDTGPSIGHHTLDHRALSKLPRLVVDLDSQLPDIKTSIVCWTNMLHGMGFRTFVSEFG